MTIFSFLFFILPVNVLTSSLPSLLLLLPLCSCSAIFFRLDCPLPPPPSFFFQTSFALHLVTGTDSLFPRLVGKNWNISATANHMRVGRLFNLFYC